MNETKEYEKKQRFKDLQKDCGQDEKDQCRAEDHARRHQTVEIVCSAPDPFKFDADFCLRCQYYYWLCEV